MNELNNAGPRLSVGVTGWRRDDWRGPVYPSSVQEGEWLAYLADPLGLTTVELDETWRREPDPDYFARLMEGAPDGPAFVVRLHQDLSARLRDERGDFLRNQYMIDRFVASLAPLIDAGRLRLVLASFPARLAKSDPAVTHLKWLLERLAPAMPLAMDFGHESWGSPSTFELLKAAKVAWVTTDRPLAAGGPPFTVAVTADDGVIRLLGRSDRWFGATGAQRYDYEYPDHELRQLLEPIRLMRRNAKRVTILFGNGGKGASVANARRLAAMLGADG
ncbi:MAG: DUF72 domain-containing protein [Nitrospinae bacterium]|nr:DUF72 domain-containing protein [Nitrospinota bacterium]